MNAQGPETGLKAGGAATVVVGVADVVVLAAAGVAPVSGVWHDAPSYMLVYDNFCDDGYLQPLGVNQKNV